MTSVMLVSMLIIGGFVGFVNFESENAHGTDVSGPIVTDTIWDFAGSPYIVTGDVTVLSGVTLTIEPGVVVKFDGFYSILVDGTLMAVGTEINRIKITSNASIPGPGDWLRIQINSGGHAEVKYCNITYSFLGIYLSESSYNNITDNDILYCQEGIHLFSSSNNNISNNNISSGGTGIWFESSSNNKIINNNKLLYNIYSVILTSSSNNNITNNNISSNIDSGIWLDSSPYNNITNNNISSNGNYGIWLDSSSDNKIIRNNIISNNRTGIEADGISNTIILNNNISWNIMNGIHMVGVSDSTIANNNMSTNGNMSYDTNDYGIWLDLSSNLTIVNNSFINDGIVIWGQLLHYFNTHTIPVNNTVNGKPLYYYKDASNFSVDDIPVGQLILANCSNVDVRNLNITNTETGIRLGFCNNIQITDNNLSSNKGAGIHLSYSSNSSITNNNISFIRRVGGIFIVRSSDNNIINNYISYSTNGIHITPEGSYNTVKNNVVIFNTYSGIDLAAPNNNITNNIALYNLEGIRVWTTSDNNIRNNNLSHNKYGIQIFDSSNNNITNNDFTNNEVAVYFPNFVFGSETNTIAYNLIADNDVGFNIELESSLGNKIHHNNIIDNIIQAIDNTTNGNQWDDGYPSGGNYWSDFDEAGEGAYDDFNGSDQNILGSDGIVDLGLPLGGKNPYVIDADSQDNYPLIKPIKSSIYLYPGWNLISIPQIQNNQDLGKVLSSIEGCYDTVWRYNVIDKTDHWKVNNTTKPPHLNDLDSIDHKMGFWIHITEPYGVWFNYPGLRLIENQTIPILPGWNLVGYPSLDSRIRAEALNNLTFEADIDSIWTYDAAIQRWDEIVTSDYFEIGRGYWIHAKTKCVWDVPL